MEITESALAAQYQRASSAWPFIHQTELAHGLPRMLLFAVGSRETNLTNEVGDFGHGHGVWQLDNRSHTPPGGFARFDVNVPLQCAIAAAMLHDMLASTGGNVEEAAAIYNSGQRGEFGTTHHNYGIDVRQRMQFLQRKFGNGSRVQQGTPAWFHRDLGMYAASTSSASATGRSQRSSRTSKAERANATSTQVRDPGHVQFAGRRSRQRSGRGETGS
jgi:hypothetical protein